MKKTITTNEQFALALEKINACPEAREWAEGLDYDTAWNTCQKPDWMLFLIHKATPLTRVQNELLVCRFAREVVHLNPDPRVLACIETREAWARGEVSDEVREATRNSGWAAAYDAAEYAARIAAEAATWAAAEATAESAMEAEGGAARVAMESKLCDIIREMVPQPVLS